MTLPEGRPGKILALGVCLVLIVMVGFSVVRPVVTLHGQMRDELRLLDSQRIRLSKLEGELPQLREQVEDLKKQEEDSENSLLLADTSDAVAAAELQTKLKALSASLGAEVSSVENLMLRHEGGFRRIGIRVMLVSDQKALTGILTALATVKPPLFVDNLEIRNSSQVMQQSEAAPKLNIGLDVYGYRDGNAQAADSRG